MASGARTGGPRGRGRGEEAVESCGEGPRRGLGGEPRGKVGVRVQVGGLQLAVAGESEG